MLEILKLRVSDDILDAVQAVEENQNREISLEECDFVIISRVNYYKLKEYEAMCSGLL